MLCSLQIGRKTAQQDPLASSELFAVLGVTNVTMKTKMF